MGDVLLRLFRMSLRLVWFMLGILPGHVLMLAHSRALAARGRPQAALLPVMFYRVVGFVLAVMLIILIDSVVGGAGSV
jgi:hypothetical protein